MKLEDLIQPKVTKFEDDVKQILSIEDEQERVDFITNLIDRDILNQLNNEYHSEIIDEFLNLGTEEELHQTELEMIQQIEIPDYLISDPEVVGYPDLYMQEKIYDWAIQYLNFSGKTILDIGAGRGDLFSVLQQFNLKSYVGIEQRGALCLVGSNQHNDPRFTLMNADYFQINAKVDIAFVIGTLNSINTDDKWAMFKSFFDKLYSEINECGIFILNSTSEDGFNSFPFSELFTELLSASNIPFTIDYSKFEGIYKLTVYKF